MTPSEVSILPMDASIWSLQKCYFSNELLKFKNFKSGSFVTYPISKALSCLAAIYPIDDLHPAFCRTINTVRIFDPSICVDGIPVLSKYNESNFIDINSISCVSPPMSVKRITLTIVVSNIQSVQFWQNNLRDLIPILRNILKLFVITNKCIINLDYFRLAKSFDLNYIIISDIDIDNEGIIGKCKASTKIDVVHLRSKLKFDQIQRSKFSNHQGKKGEYQQIADVITYCKTSFHAKQKMKISKQILLIGPPGCGKTTLVQTLASDFGIILISILGPEIFCPKPGDTEKKLREIFQQAIDHTSEGICILLLDEVDCLCPKKDKSSKSPHALRTLTQLLALLEKADAVDGLLVIGTTNQPQSIDPSVRRPGRLEREIHFGIPSEKQRSDILRSLIDNFVDLPLDEKSDLSFKIAELTQGFVCADLSLLCQDVAFRCYKEKVSLSSMKDFLAKFRTSMRKIQPTSLRSSIGLVKCRSLKLCDIGGLAKLKKSLRCAVEWPLRHPDTFTRLGIPCPRGILLYGPPGCAKTTLACAIAMETNMTFLAASVADLYSAFVGDAEKNLVQLFHQARLGAPSILFLDEIDGLVGSRSHGQNKVQERVLSTLLTEIDGIGVRMDSVAVVTEDLNRVIVIAATNRPDMLDDALLRPGRFDKLLYVPPPDYHDRLEILKVATSKTPLSSNVILEEIAQSTELFSGADLSNLCKEAALCALTQHGMKAAEVDIGHFQEALKGVNSSLTRDQVKWYEEYSTVYT